MKSKKLVFIFILFVFFMVQVNAQSHSPLKPLTPQDLFNIKKVTEPVLSPDGKWIAYTISVPNFEKNSYSSDIWLVPAAGGTPKQLTTDPADDSSPRWSPDGKSIAFISDRDKTENIYLYSIRTGETKKLTNSTTALASPYWSKNGKFILCKSRFVPEKKESLENWTKNELPECKAKTINHLLFRESNKWLGDARNHLILVNCADGSTKDVTPADADVPPVALNSAQDFDISPDGKEICFVRNDAPIAAISTNQDVFILDTETLKETRITDNPALDHQPHYSPDGLYIAYTAMKKPGLEADRQCLTLYNRKTGARTSLTEPLDRSVVEFTWTPDSKSFYFTCYEEGRNVIYHVDLNGNYKRISNEGFNSDLNVSPDGKTLVCLRTRSNLPAEVFSISLKEKGKKKNENGNNGNNATQLTFTNKEFLSQFELPKLEDFWFTGAENAKVHGFLLKPPAFDSNKTYPLIMVIHGGPQGTWLDRFSYSYANFQLYAAPGYVAIFIDPRGSEGYGSPFMEEVSKDYGNRSYVDLMNGLDHVIANNKFVDSKRLAAAGGSFGGYMVNWINGHTDRFKCLVCHAGLYNLVSFYGATDETWFAAWDLGETPWREPEIYAKWSPHGFAGNFKTPTLITQGECDYRVPMTESLQLFTALQVQGIPSRLVLFPDAGHGITAIQDAMRWWKEVYRWLDTYLK
ncbi:MAG: prolyl oligopeptidase family serine peptidase [Candidatus Omnitrophota bacterium]